MQRQDYSFTFSLFAKKVQMFHWKNMGVVVEKEPDVICVYGTNSTNSNILCAIPLCHPRFLKGEAFLVSFFEDDTVIVKVADVLVAIDFASKKCSNNRGLHAYGSAEWGQDVGCDWDPSYAKRVD